jgi:HAD superfamily hydrolase (TIGR01549 family)
MSCLGASAQPRSCHGERQSGRADKLWDMIDAVVFDVGEVLINETREYGTWADWLGVPRHTFSAVFGAVISTGGDYREVFQYFQPGFDLETERLRRADAGKPETFGEDDLYPDVRPCMSALSEMGVWVGVAGNQTARAGAILRGLRLPADMIATSDDWGVSKPDEEFFHAVTEAASCEPGRIVYVGDRLDNDLKPAKKSGMVTAFIRRGPWGFIWEHHPDMANAADWRMESLADLPGLVASVNRSVR